ncbi:ABC transporter B family member 29, chloroplastic isoform X1 [Macadamia integrifolia]|uniref:ABC transporter B family member 29, chloroplastic isoform X1 n=1 Tax=Macadamia integrifolia TaxID=60698 RepID=UPI001C4FAB1B|nr:ABC transporter B family member 29, chloroplastic isoform X1 [Macadamia integrifolia]
MAVIRVASPTSNIFFVSSKFNFTAEFIHFNPQSKSFLKTSLKTCSSITSYSFSPFNRLNSLKHEEKPRRHTSRLFLPSLEPIKPYIQSEWRSILMGWTCSFVSVCCLSKIVPKLGKLSAVVSKMDANRLTEEGLVFGVLILVRLVANYWQQALLWDATLNSVYKIRVYVFERVLQRDLGFFEGGGAVSAGDIAYRITAEASDVSETVYALLNTVIPSILQLSAMATQMLVISPVLSLISVLVIPPMSLLIAYLGERLRKISKKAQLSAAALSAYLNEVLPSILFVKANNAEVCEGARFQRLAYADLFKRLKKKKMKALIPQILQVIYVGALLIFCAGSMMVSRGSFDGSALISFVTSLILLIEPIQKQFILHNQGIGKAYDELKQGEPALERLFDLTRFNSEVIVKPDAVDLASVRGDVNFCNISFKYGDNMPLILNGLNLHINPGETVAIIGPSGGGKTTLSKLLLRLYDPLCGSVLIDNLNIQDIQLESLRQHVGLVSQDITLFSGTVAENIGYRDLMRQIDMERVERAAMAANADEFTRTLSEGYETNIGPRGSILSGGQKQRIAIARTLYQNPSILILDEATSALDSGSEILVRKAVEHLMGNRTVLVIAHRLETVLMANRIFLLDKGKLVEVSRSFLLSKDNLYGSLVSNAVVI